MFPRYCASCFTRHGESHLLCFPCRDELSDLRIGQQDAILSCFRYKGVMRSLILRAKVQGDHRAVGLLCDLLLKEDVVAAWAGSVDVLVPSPSSLWSRARGRLDLAALLVDALAARFGKSVLVAPWDLHWRIKKRALSTRRERLPLADVPRDWDGNGEGPRIGLFDDVVTTGQTLAWTRAALPPLAGVRPLTLASARE